MRRSPLLFVALLLAVATALAQVPAPPVNDAEPLASLNDIPKFDATRDEAGQDRVAAAALFAHGRMLQQRRDYAGALSRYQRAYRYDDKSRGLQEIVSLAMEAGRLEQAARYAVLGDEPRHDLIVLRRLAVDSTNRQDWRLAARLYEASLSPIGSEASRSATQVLMRAEMGRLSFLAGDFVRSAQAFADVRAALAKPEEYDLNESIQKIIIGDRRQTYSLMARAALEAEQYDDAVTLFRETFRDLPESDEALLATASVADRRGDTALAIKLCTPVLERGGREGSAAAEYLRRALAKTTPPEQLESLLEASLAPAHAAHPDNESLRRHLAQCRLNQGKLAEAEAMLTDAALEKPSEELRLLLAATQRHQKVADKFLATLASVVATTSISNAEDEARLAARDAEFAAAILTVARSAKSESAEEKAAQGVAAVISLELKQYDDAEKFWEASLPEEVAARGRLLLLWGLRLTQANQFQRAMETFQRVLREKLADDDPGPVHYYLAGAAAFAGEQELALEAARNAQQARTDDIRFQQREAWVLQHAKRYVEARQKYDGILQHFEKSHDAKVRGELLQARRMLSTICVELSEYTAAAERLEEVLDEFPDDSGALNDLGYLWADRGLHLQRSLRMVQRAVAAEPDKSAFRDSLGWVYFRLGRFDEAVVELEKASSGEQPGGVILNHLGDALAKAGRAGEARSVWQKALETFRKDGDEKNVALVEKKLRDK